MIPALIIFIVTYVLLIAFQKWRPYIALGSAALFIILGYCGVFEMNILSALKAVDYNVLMMISGTMATVSLFIESKMPQRLSEILLHKVSNVKWAIAVLSLFAGVISAFVDNVATVLMVAPVGLAISKKLKISPVPVLISIAVSSNLQGAATLVGDTTSILLGGFADMNFMEFFWMNGRPGIFFGVELGAIASLLVLLFIFRKNTQPIDSKIETTVEDYFPSILMIATVVFLIIASFLPKPESGALLTIYELRSGIICVALCLIGIIRACIRRKNGEVVKLVLGEFDKDTVLLLFGLFIIIEGIKSAGVIDAIAQLFFKVSGDNPFLLYTIIVFASVVLSAFIDNIPYVATMLPVVQSIAALMGLPAYVFYFGLLTGATLGGNLTPIGASANIAAIGILRKNGETVKTKDFLKIGVPFTLSAVLVGYAFVWLAWGI
ncbi:MAG: SLC13 family permease [Oscillospiraceae bacterium]|nr:arsenic transporter [Oscillospiraceae bacterium]MDD7354844.1 SLC13 family permease [Oscillospiraceae bacterium]MDY3937742.1 SLC13 family permease [Oscillospiraceae bacterium]